MLGETISHYRILEKLGGGGMGIVYKAEDAKLKRLVALKFLPPELTRDEEAKTRFVHEAQMASSLDHPNLCTIYAIDEIPLTWNFPVKEQAGQMFIAMAYYDGETLKQRIAKGENQSAPSLLTPHSSSFAMPRGLSLVEVFDFAVQIAQGLAKAHQHGIVHRDLKPGNVMVTREGVVKIIDFGLAKLMGEAKLTKAGVTRGTVAYMSPEQAGGEEVDQRTDIWSLGVMLYEMLAGELPFTGELDPAVIYAILNEAPESLKALRPDLPVALERVIEKAMQKDRDARYHHAAEMLADLKSIAQDGAVAITTKERGAAASPRSPKQFLPYTRTAFLILLLGLGFAIWRFAEEKNATRPPDPNHLAVLPLVNISPDPKDEYFAEGMTEELISTLSQIRRFRVIARTSVMRYKGGTQDIAAIARELNVGTILEGSVRKAGNKLRITVKLVDARSQEHLWTQSYDRPLADVFAIQSDIAQQVAEALQLQLLRDEKQKLEKKGAGNLEAYTLFLRGRYFWNQRTAEGIQRGIEYFERALAADSACALAYAGLADAYILLGTFEYDGLAPKSIIPKARAAAQRALALDETLVEAQAALANIKFSYEWDWPSAEREFQRVLALSPSYAEAHHRYAHYLAAQARFEEALAEERLALELDPLSLIINTQMGVIFYYMRRYDEAIAQYRKTLELDSNFVQARIVLGAAFAQKAMFEEALAELKRAFELSEGNALAAALLAYVYGVSGKKNEARKMLEELQQPAHLALAYLGLDEKEQALTALEKAYEARSNYLVFLKVEPFADPLRAHPRFIALLEKMGLQE